jgi:hypothetical protein
MDGFRSLTGKLNSVGGHVNEAGLRLPGKIPAMIAQLQLLVSAGRQTAK